MEDVGLLDERGRIFGRTLAQGYRRAGDDPRFGGPCAVSRRSRRQPDGGSVTNDPHAEKKKICRRASSDPLVLSPSRSSGRPHRIQALEAHLSPGAGNGVAKSPNRQDGPYVLRPDDRRLTGESGQSAPGRIRFRVEARRGRSRRGLADERLDARRSRHASETTESTVLDLRGSRQRVAGRRSPAS